MIRRMLAFLAAAGLAPVLAGAQPTWERVQSLGPNQTVALHLQKGELLKGKLQSAGVDGLKLLVKGQKTLQVARADIDRVTKKSRARGAMWGGIFGFGIAAPIGAYAGPYIADYGNPSGGVRMRYAAGFGLFFGGIGAAVGALTGAETTLYRAPATGSSRAR